MKQNHFKFRNSRDSTAWIENISQMKAYCRLLLWLLRSKDLKMAYLLANRIFHLRKKNGPLFTVKYLKECVRLIQVYVAGVPEYISKDLPVSITAGLPSIIPGSLRLRMKDKDLDCIRVVLSLLSVYRTMKAPGQLKLSTITDPFSGISQTLSEIELRVTLEEMGLLNRFTLTYKDFHISGSAGPNYRRSPLGAELDCLALSESNLESAFLNGCRIVGAQSLLTTYMETVAFIGEIILPLKKPILGKLVEKLEAAGKVRVFAIIDCWSQSLLKPLHEAIFSYLRLRPEDGTFNQTGPLDRLKEYAIRERQNGRTVKFFCFDLSAATDRVPAILQRDIISMILNKEQSMFCHVWYELLVKRDWYHGFNKNNPGTPIRYTVGQPMGALSSWGMLALSHHIIVQVAAIRVGKHRFSAYALLGDDIVLADEAVANSYLALMTEWLGVDINMSKSLTSNEVFEFAKRLVTLDGEVTPVGPRNLAVGLKSINGILSLFTDIIGKGVRMTAEQVEEMFSLPIPTVKSKRAKKNLLWAVIGPFGLMPTRDGLTSSMKLVNSLTPVRVNSLISSIDETIHEENLENWNKEIDRMNKHIIAWMRPKVPGFTYSNESYSRFLAPISHLLGQRQGNVGPYYLPSKTSIISMSFEGLLSPIRKLLIAQVESKFQVLLNERPVKRLIFDGPVIMFNYYREGYMAEIVKYISFKVSKIVKPSMTFDPFESPEAEIPRLLGKGDAFFLKVRERQQKATEVALENLRSSLEREG